MISICIKKTLLKVFLTFISWHHRYSFAYKILIWLGTFFQQGERLKRHVNYYVHTKI